jgi:hypothetical protein
VPDRLQLAKKATSLEAARGHEQDHHDDDEVVEEKVVELLRQLVPGEEEPRKAGKHATPEKSRSLYEQRGT